MSFSNISFILHKPQLSENIGACARAIKNFNFNKLLLINPKPLFPNDKILATSVGAKDIIKKTKVFSNIEESIKKIDVLNRTIKKALEFQNNHIFAYELDNAENIIQNNSIIINTTSVGMYNNESPIGYDLIHKDQIIIDIIYTPLQSKLLQFGEKAGALTINGLDMFINQGIASLDLWFGSSISTQVNFSDIKRYLKSQLC